MNTIYKQIAIYFIIGIIASLVPIYLIGIAKENDENIDLNYFQFVRWAPLFFGIFNIILLFIMNIIGLNNCWIIGIIAGTIISSVDRFIQKIPTKVFKMGNPNLFHIYAIIVWGLFYGLIVKNILTLMNCANILVLDYSPIFGW